MASAKGIIQYNGPSVAAMWTVFLVNIALYALLIMVSGALLHIGWLWV